MQVSQRLRSCPLLQTQPLSRPQLVGPPLRPMRTRLKPGVTDAPVAVPLPSPSAHGACYKRNYCAALVTVPMQLAHARLRWVQEPQLRALAVRFAVDCGCDCGCVRR